MFRLPQESFSVLYGLVNFQSRGITPDHVIYYAKDVHSANKEG